MKNTLIKTYSVARTNLSDSGEDKQSFSALLGLLSDVLLKHHCDKYVTVEFALNDGSSRIQYDQSLFEDAFVNGKPYEMISFFASGKTDDNKSISITVIFTRIYQPCTITLETSGFTEAALKDIVDEIASCIAITKSDSERNDKRKKHKRVNESEHLTDKSKTLQNVKTVCEIIVAITVIITFIVSALRFFGCL